MFDIMGIETKVKEEFKKLHDKLDSQNSRVASNQISNEALGVKIDALKEQVSSFMVIFTQILHELNGLSDNSIKEFLDKQSVDLTFDGGDVTFHGDVIEVNDGEYDPMKNSTNVIAGGVLFSAPTTTVLLPVETPVATHSESIVEFKTHG